MPQSLTQLYMHLIFSTKDRQPVLDPDIRSLLKPYFGGIYRNLHSPCLAVECMADHVHILYSHSKNTAPCDLVEEIKTSTSKWLKTQNVKYRPFHWQRGYGMFSVSPTRILAVKQYIMRQEIHHRTLSFQDEYRRFLKEYGIAYDERYVWD